MRGLLKLENGISSHDSIDRLFGLLDEQTVEKYFRRWGGGVLPALAECRVVAIDGKARRRCRQAGKQALHIASANAGANRAIIRRPVRDLFRLDISRKVGILARRISAASSDPYRAAVLGLQEVRCDCPAA